MNAGMDVRSAARRIGRVLGCGLICVALAPALRASDWYVDAQFGDNANNGMSPAGAWKTLSFALGAIPNAPLVEHTLHVAPGLYDLALGEVFPLLPQPLLRIVGTQGSAQTLLEGATGSFFDYSMSPLAPVDLRSGLAGLTLRNAAIGLRVFAGTSAVSPLFEDLRIEHMSTVGVEVAAGSAGLFSSTFAHPEFRELRVGDCNTGLSVHASAGQLESASASVTLIDSSVSDSVSDGINYIAQGSAGAGVKLTRTRVQRNGRDGTHGASFGGITSASLTANACLFSDNVGCGAFGETGPNGEAGNFWFNDCTIAGNPLAGVRGLRGQNAVFKNSIIAGNGLDIDTLQAAYGEYCCTQGPALLGFPGCIVANPAFVDPALGDWRLRFGSPCVESGVLSAPGVVDLLGQPRSLDGDLDTHGAPDMGAFEFAPLAILGSPQVGGALDIEQWGAPASLAQLMVARGPLLPAQATPLGDFYLARRATRVLGNFTIPAAGVHQQSWHLLANPAWIGITLSFQSTIGSVAAPQGRALSNPVSFVVLP